jgi:DNA-directed RNA polymerase specialized sigma24 family protein
MGDSMEPTTELYLKHKKQISLIANKIARHSGFAAEDLISESNVIFCECLPNYNPRLGSLNTYLDRCLTWGLYHYMRSISRHNVVASSDDRYDLAPAPVERENLFQSVTDAMSAEARLCIDVIFDNMAINKTGLKRHLKQKGWKSRKIQHVFVEIQKALPSLAG